MPKQCNDSVDEVDSTAYFPLDGNGFLFVGLSYLFPNNSNFKQRITIRRLNTA